MGPRLLLTVNVRAQVAVTQDTQQRPISSSCLHSSFAHRRPLGGVYVGGVEGWPGDSEISFVGHPVDNWESSSGKKGAELMETQGDVTASEIVSARFYFSKLLQLIVVAEVETRSGTSTVIQ